MEDHFSEINFLKGDTLKSTRETVLEIMKSFKTFGAEEVELPTLFDVDFLLNLYGENLRSTAFTVLAPLSGEKVLRPEFTVPIVMMHIKNKKNYGIYSYSGPVWRKKTYSESEINEFTQVGIEVFHKNDSLKYDAELFKLFSDIIGFKGVEIEIGDLGVLRSLLDLIDISDYKKNMLLKHLWRPKRFRSLLNKFSDLSLKSKSKNYLNDLAVLEGLGKKAGSESTIFGIRTVEDIKERIFLLNEESNSLPIKDKDVKLILEVQSLFCNLVDAPSRLLNLFGKEDKFIKTVEKLKKRTDEIARLNINVKNLPFAVSHLRSGAEFYDGFIFGFFLKNMKNLPPLAKGGRFNTLTNLIGKGKKIPAVGGMIRPDLYSRLHE